MARAFVLLLACASLSARAVASQCFNDPAGVPEPALSARSLGAWRVAAQQCRNIEATPERPKLFDRDQFTALITEFETAAAASMAAHLFAPERRGDRSAEQTRDLLSDRVANDDAFLARATLPANARVAVFGDLHGQFDVFVQELARLRDDAQFFVGDSMRLEPNNYVVIMGDMVDRGPMGASVYALAMALAVNNPERVFLLRG